jgi:hypothetical protein
MRTVQLTSITRIIYMYLHFFCNTSSGNRTPAARAAGEHSTTEPPMRWMRIIPMGIVSMVLCSLKIVTGCRHTHFEFASPQPPVSRDRGEFNVKLHPISTCEHPCEILCGYNENWWNSFWKDGPVYSSIPSTSIRTYTSHCEHMALCIVLYCILVFTHTPPTVSIWLRV